MGFKQDVIIRLDKLAERQEEHTITLAKNTIILTDHHVRSSQLESRVKPIENHVIVVNGIVKVAITIIATIASLGAAYHYLLK